MGLFDGAKIDSIKNIINCKKKSELEKYCKSITLNISDLSLAVAVGAEGGFFPYLYARSFSEQVPDHLQPTEEDFDNLTHATKVKGKTAKTFRKIIATFYERRMRAAHLFYTPDHNYWYLFYFDQRDRSGHDNHWVHGPHIHLLSHHWPNLKLADVWEKVKGGNTDFPRSIHLRFERND